MGKTRFGSWAQQPVLLIGIRSADYIRASGHGAALTGRTHDLHPTASEPRRISLATRASSTHDPKRFCRCAMFDWPSTTRCRVSVLCGNAPDGTSRDVRFLPATCRGALEFTRCCAHTFTRLLEMGWRHSRP